MLHFLLQLRKVPDDKGGIARFLSHLDEPNLKPVITDESVTFSTSNAVQTSRGENMHNQAHIEYWRVFLKFIPVLHTNYSCMPVRSLFFPHLPGEGC